MLRQIADDRAVSATLTTIAYLILAAIAISIVVRLPVIILGIVAIYLFWRWRLQ